MDHGKPPVRRLDRSDLRDRSPLPGSGDVATDGKGDPSLCAIRRLAGDDGPGSSLRRDDQPLCDAVLAPPSGLSTVLWAATMIAVLARLAMSVRENKRLLELVRTDQLTGLGQPGHAAGRPGGLLSSAPRRSRRPCCSSTSTTSSATTTPSATRPATCCSPARPGIEQGRRARTALPIGWAAMSSAFFSPARGRIST